MQPGGPLLCNLQAQARVVAAVADGRLVASGSSDGTLKVWDVDRTVCMLSVHAHRDGVSALAGVDGRRQVVSGGNDGLLRAWDLDTGL